MGQASTIEMQSGVTEVVACGFQVNRAANGETSQCRAIFSLTGVVRFAAALWTQSITLSRTSSPALGNNTCFCSNQRHLDLSVLCFPALESGHFLALACCCI